MRLACFLVELHQVRRVVGLHPVEDLHVQRVLMKERRGSVAPVQPEGPVVLLNVARPQLLAGEVERLQDAEAGEDPHVGAVRHRGRRRHVLLVDPVIAGRDRTLPLDVAACAVDGPELDRSAFVLGRHVEEDSVVPDDRRGAGPARHRELPRDVLGGTPLDRQPFVGGGTVQLRTAPLGPVVRRHRRHREHAERQRQPQTIRHDVSLPQ